MISGWKDTDYAITGVRYSITRRSIFSVEVFEVDTTTGSTMLWNRNIVDREWVYNMLQTYKFVTAPPSNNNGQYHLGDEVIRTVNGYIRTVGNSSQYDNLGALPEF